MSPAAVLVTGAGSGIGEGIAEVLARRGAAVLVNDVDAALAESVAKRVGGTAVPGDVTGDAAELVGRAVAVHGRLDGLVNNAGVLRRSTLLDVPVEELDLVYRVNLRAVVLLSRAALPHLAAGGGAIVNVSSMTAFTPQVVGGLYSASKAGIVALTRQAAVEWGPAGVRVNAVAPGMIRSAMSAAVYADPVFAEKRRVLAPLRRIGEPSDVGSVVAFLLSSDAGYVTGQTITVDGGLLQTLIEHVPQPFDVTADDDA
ncbi:SDR family NAD(P)-dependent oxidoreductase [Pseudonocardia sp. GCM10023141]|uniref:SDR family NAD(P)-dependent oxidoreductase n=1 Tax=Pseudonocardia sp. GCM10023141 TaxID=3252653 RepID=UPI00361B7B3F